MLWNVIHDHYLQEITHTHTHTHAHAQTHTNTRTNTHTHKHTHTNIHTQCMTDLALNFVYSSLFRLC